MWQRNATDVANKHYKMWERIATDVAKKHYRCGNETLQMWQ